jgi:hypothetical protein
MYIDFFVLYVYIILCWGYSVLNINIFAHCRWHTVAVTVDADSGEASAFVDGVFDGDLRFDLPLPAEGGILQEGMEVWVGIRPPMDLDAFGRSDSEGAESRMHAMDVFMWGRCLSEEEIQLVHNSTIPEDYNDTGTFDDDWQGSPMETPMRV